MEDGRSPIWGGGTLGLIIGLIGGLVTGNIVSYVVYGVLIGASCGVLSIPLAMLGEWMQRKAGPSRRFVLEVEPEEHTREHLEWWLRQHGFSTKEAVAEADSRIKAATEYVRANVADPLALVKTDAILYMPPLFSRRR